MGFLIEQATNRHPSTQNIVKWLEPSEPVKARNDNSTAIANAIAGVTALALETIKQDSPELTAGLRHLLEAKDALVRAVLDEQPGFWTDR